MKFSKGLTFLEIIIALSLFTIALLGIFQMFNMALNAGYRATQETIATNLARGLMNEIMSKNFEDPMEPGTDIGPNTEEITRSHFDDVDDYHGLTESPPVTVGGADMDGTGEPPLPDYSDFTRNVTVVYCNIDGANNIVVSGSPTNYKQIKVTVSGPYTRDILIDAVKARVP
ncbi:MAG: hypothetical protein ABH952_06050 [Candidatus Omnitrophota bacterium]